MRGTRMLDMAGALGLTGGAVGMTRGRDGGFGRGYAHGPCSSKGTPTPHGPLGEAGAWGSPWGADLPDMGAMLDMSAALASLTGVSDKAASLDMLSMQRSRTMQARRC